MLSVFTRFFPPPSYVQMPAFGIDFTDRTARFVQLAEKRGAFQLGVYGAIALPEGAIVGGEIKDAHALSVALNNTRHKFPARHVIATLPEERTYLTLLQLPDMRQEELRVAVESELAEHIPIPPGEAVYDFELQPVDLFGKRHRDVIVSAAPRRLVEDYRDALCAAGLLPLAFEVETHAVARAVVARNEERAVLVVNLGETRTSIAVVLGTQVRFAATLALGGSGFDTLLTKTFGDEGRTLALASVPDREKVSSEPKKIFTALLPQLSAIKDEIGAHIRFWDTQRKQHTEATVSTVLLAGSYAHVFGLEEYLSYQLALPVRIANPWVNITDVSGLVPELHARDAATFAAAIGLAMRGARYIS